MKKPTLKNITSLHKKGLVADQELELLNEVGLKFNVAITPEMLELINPFDANDPIANQFIPKIEELIISPQEKSDPIGDIAHGKIKGLVHRYPDRCLLKPIQICPIYCRFCFRRETVGSGEETLSNQELNDAYAYIRAHPEIWEVILTGGDPLILKPNYLANIMKALTDIPTVEIIRIHTRVPVVDPSRIDAELIAAMKVTKPVYVVLHANHPREFTEAAKKACALLVDAGLPMLSQSVLLKNVNDNIATLSELMRTFIRNRIKPYYLHHADLTKGTAHFRTSIATGQKLMQELRGHYSGLCQPTYVLDIPGGFGKSPINSIYMHEEDKELKVQDYQGNWHVYPEDCE